MTSLLALAGAPASLDDQRVRALLTGASPGGDGTVAVVRPAPGVVMAVTSPEWDERAALRAVTDGRYTVVAHAAIFYRRALNAELKRVAQEPLPSDAPPALAILAALRAWHWQCVDHLEGEFAFVAWDGRERTLFAARDHTGARPLFHTTIGDGIAVGSRLRLVRAVPGCRGEWNLIALCEDAADIDLAVPAETVYRDIARVPGGHALTWRPGGRCEVRRWWQIPIFERDSGVPFEEGAEELRRLIADAVAERTDVARGTAVMLSGGYDSPAIYAAGNWRLGSGATTAPLRSVSFSHPPGDPGREDELIEATTRRWGAAPYFIPIGEVPAIEPSLERARRRDEPLYHSYELWNRALAAGTRTQGARIALNGSGGDPWFSTSPVFLADLLRQGHLRQFRREWRALLGRMTPYRLFKTAIQPNLPPGLLSLMAMARGGRPLSDHHVRLPPAWVAEPMRHSPELLARRRIDWSRRRGESLSALGRTWFLRAMHPERIAALVFSICQTCGVELRTPLLDNRIVQFAATRPRWESNSGRQNKHLLRYSMRGLLPEEVVAPRVERTGSPVTYLKRTLHAHLREGREAFSNGMLLADLGVVDHRRLLDEVDSFLAGSFDDLERANALMMAIQAEWWLRSAQ